MAAFAAKGSSYRGTEGFPTRVSNAEIESFIELHDHRVFEDASQTTEEWWEPQLPALVILLQVIAADVLIKNPVAGRNLPNVGYSTWPEDKLHSLINLVLPRFADELRPIFGESLPSSAGEVMDRVDEFEPGALPVKSGPIIRRKNGTHVAVDLFAASVRMSRMIQIPSQATDSVRRARDTQLELTTQALIDRSLWARSSMDPVRGFRPRRGRNYITDFDAVGSHDGTLLLIDAKSYLYTYELDAGFHREVWSSKKHIERDTTAWNEKVVKVGSTHDPVENFDFSRYDRIVGVVVVPHLLYVTEPHALEVVLESPTGVQLRAMATIGELRRFLNSYS